MRRPAVICEYQGTGPQKVITASAHPRRMDLILVRYAEMGLKSVTVRKRFEKVLVDNIMAALAAERIEGLVESERGRIYVRTDRIEEAIRPVSRVFGVASLSGVIETTSNMDDIRSLAVSYSRERLKKGDSFAMRVRRTGTHPFTSADVARDVGAAVVSANVDLEVTVDLDSPDLELFVEVRNNRAFVFSEYVPGPGGLPMGSQGKILAIVDKERDVVAAWLMMKRGCKVVIVSSADRLIDILAKWDPSLRVASPAPLEHLTVSHRALAVAFGYGVEDIEEIKKLSLPVPAFFPLVGMNEEEIEKRFEAIGS
ncbi:MAG: THUMP domain-containing protein [Methanomassiliicoccales archaeon]|nr:THUMP domain-containing protein [Methanomassiliicoccales archaeon]